MNQGVHTVDLLLWFLGRPVEIYAHTALLAHERVEVEDTAVATVRFESGALAMLHATTAAYPGVSVRLQVHGSRGSAVIDNDELVYFHAARDGDVIGAARPTGSGNQAEAELAARPGDRGDGPVRRARAASTSTCVARDRRGHDAAGERRGRVLALATVQAVYLSASWAAGAVDDVLAGNSTQSSDHRG